MADFIKLTNEEAMSLFYHMETSILTEIRNVAEDYDNMGYLVNLVHIYERCKAVEDESKRRDRKNDE